MCKDEDWMARVAGALRILVALPELALQLHTNHRFFIQLSRN